MDLQNTWDEDIIMAAVPSIKLPPDAFTFNSRVARENRPKVIIEYSSPCTDIHSEAYESGGQYKKDLRDYAEGRCHEPHHYCGWVSQSVLRSGEGHRQRL